MGSKDGAAPRWYAETEDWFLDGGLSERSSEELIDELMPQLRAHGLPVTRFAAAFGTLNPLFQSGNLLWRNGQSTVREYFRREDIGVEEWLRSPMKAVLDGPDRFLAWRLPDPEAAERFPLLADIANEGNAFYAVDSQTFSNLKSAREPPYDGILFSWAGDSAEPFEAEDFRWLRRLDRRIAVVAKAQAREARALSVTSTYLGPLIGPRIWQGKVMRGDVEELEGVLWFSDLRNSTHLAATLPPQDFMRLLNDFFDCTAAKVEAAGGAVLKFIGDAVLAVFPQPLTEAVQAALGAAREAETARREINAKRRAAGEAEIVYGLGLRCGQVLFGNVGTPERLDFTVIGPAVNEVVRMESLTKERATDAIVDKDVAAAAPGCWPGCWNALGEVRLRGIERSLALFARREDTSL